jgi:hypothetical protein
MGDGDDDDNCRIRPGTLGSMKNPLRQITSSVDLRSRSGAPGWELCRPGGGSLSH